MQVCLLAAGLLLAFGVNARHAPKLECFQYVPPLQGRAVVHAQAGRLACRASPCLGMEGWSRVRVTGYGVG